MADRMYCTVCRKHRVAPRKARLSPFPDLPSILVETGFQTCPGCGETQTSYFAMGPLLEAIGRAVLAKPGSLTPAEAQFLRDAELKAPQGISKNAKPLSASLTRDGTTWTVVESSPPLP